MCCELAILRKFMLIVIIIAACCLASTANLTRATYVCGLKSGDWVKYNISVSYGGQQLTGSLKISVQSVQGTTVNATIEGDVTGFSTQPEQITFDVGAGTGTYAGYVIPANLTTGDYIPGESAYVGNVVVKNGRKAIVANASSPYMGISAEVYWDQATGVLLETSGSAVGTTFAITVADTNLWSGGFAFLFDWWIWVIIIVVIAAAVSGAVLIMRRRKPAVTQPPSQIPPPPPPPPT